MSVGVEGPLLKGQVFLPSFDLSIFGREACRPEARREAPSGGGVRGAACLHPRATAVPSFSEVWLM